MILSLCYLGSACMAVFLTALLGAGVLRLLWLVIRTLWEERNTALLILLALAGYPLATDPMLRSTVGLLLICALLIAGAFQALDELVPVIQQLWQKLHGLVRLALIGVWVDISLDLYKRILP